MASAQIIDLDSLLAPVSEDAPTGDNPRSDASPNSLYYTLKRERSSARSAERKSVHDSDSQEADKHWQQVTELAPRLLKEQSKDLEVASWYTEALVRRFGFQGLRDAFGLIRGLVEQHWDGLYPMPDEDGMETRIAPLSGLNGEGAEGVLMAPIRKIPITEGHTPGPFSLWQYQQALDIQKLSDEEAREAKEESLGYGLSDIERAVAESSEQFFLDQREDLDQALEHYRACSDRLDEYCGAQEAPPTRNIIEVLEECRGAINHLGRDKYASLEADNEQTEDQESEGGESTGAKPASRRKQLDREEAFRQLREIARFFRETEPHSPVSYVLQKAVKWGNMSLEELITELIPDDSSRAHYSELTGVQAPEE